MTSSDPVMVSGEPIAHQAARALTAWLPDEEAVITLLGRSPLPDDDLSPVLGRIAAARAALASRPALEVATPVVLLDERAPLEALQARPDLTAAFGLLDWRVEIVDLTRVQAAQKTIGIVGIDDRVAPLVDRSITLADFCLPATVPAPPVGALADAGQRGFAISSVNPNLRIVGTDLTSAELSTPTGPIKVQAISFFVNFGSSYMNVARCDGRHFLRDGYHRAAALLRAGITEVPAIVVDFGGRFDEMMPSSQIFPRSVCFGAWPPMLSDFWNPAVSDEVRRPSTRKVVRIRGEEFFLPG